MKEKNIIIIILVVVLVIFIVYMIIMFETYKNKSGIFSKYTPPELPGGFYLLTYVPMSKQQQLEKKNFITNNADPPVS